MQTKLTLRLDDDLIAAAKDYAARRGKPLSRIVADLFEVIRDKAGREEEDLPPAVRSLRGVLRGTGVTEEDYKKYLETKSS